MPLSSTHRCPSRFYARLMRPVTVLSTRPFTPSLLRLFTLAAIPTHKQPLQHPLLCSRRTARLPVLHKGHFPFVPSPYCFRQRSVAGCYGPYFANRGFHATTPAQKTLLTGAIVTIFFQCTRPVLTGKRAIKKLQIIVVVLSILLNHILPCSTANPVALAMVQVFP